MRRERGGQEREEEEKRREREENRGKKKETEREREKDIPFPSCEYTKQVIFALLNSLSGFFCMCTVQ